MKKDFGNESHDVFGGLFIVVASQAFAEMSGMQGPQHEGMQQWMEEVEGSLLQALKLNLSVYLGTFHRGPSLFHNTGLFMLSLTEGAVRHSQTQIHQRI